MTTDARSLHKPQRWGSIKRNERIGDIASTILLTVLGLASLFPFYWMASTAFKTEFEAFQFPPTLYPHTFTFENFQDITTGLPFAQFFVNSIKISLLGIAGQLITSSMAAFAFARLEFRGRDKLFILILGTMMVPGITTIIPLYVIIYKVGLVNTHWPLILPAVFGSAYGTFLLRQYMLSLPTELEDAARIDGCNSFRIYWQIAMPLMKPALATLGVFGFMGLWNDFFGPLVFLDRLELYTVQVGAALARGQWYTHQPRLMAGSVMITIPVLIVFLFLQRYFVQGISLTGIKG